MQLTVLVTTFLATWVHLASAASFPQLAFIGRLTISITAGQNIPINYGTRVLNSYLEGNATDPNGNTIATIIPGEGGEGGFTDPTGLFHPSVRGALFFKEEPAYGFFTTQGYKTSTAEYLYVTVETNSTKYNFLNHLFIISNATKSADSVLHLDLFSPEAGLPAGVF